MNIYSFLLILAFSLLACSPSKTKDTHKIAGNAIGTVFHITYIGTERKDLVEKVDSIVYTLNRSLSTYQQTSFISSFNMNNETVWQEAHGAGYFETDMRHFLRMVNSSKIICEQTQGAFDPSAKLLYDEYAKAKKQHRLMDDSAVLFALNHKGMHTIQFDIKGFPYKLDSLVQLNFNAIAKGYLVDLIADYLSQIGVANYMVEVGGEMRIKGKNAKGELWKVGINLPQVGAKPTELFNVLELQDCALATSGNYENFYTVNGKIIGHTLDPRYGSHVITNLKSVSVLHQQCAVADAYATACMVLGQDESRKLIAQDSSLSAYFIFDNGHGLEGEFVE